MADNKKYYYIKIKDDFYDSEELILLQGMPDGYLYSDILMKLYLRSLKNNGKLMFKDRVPYNPSSLAPLVRHQVGTVEKALGILANLGLVEILDNGAIYMLDIQNFIGESSTEADRKREYRERIKAEKSTLLKLSDKCPDISPPKKEIKKELKLDIEDRKIDNTREKIKLIQSETYLYNDFFKELEIYIEDIYLEVLPEELKQKVALQQNAVKVLMDSNSEIIRNLKNSDLDVAYRKYKPKEANVDNPINYYLTILEREVMNNG